MKTANDSSTTNDSPSEKTSIHSPTSKTTQKNTAIHLISGGIAGLCEALSCHPLDTIKVRMQLSTLEPTSSNSTFKLTPARTAISIVKNEGFFALYKGLGAVVSALVPKMAIRFVSFEAYRSRLQTTNLFSQGKDEKTINFLSGLGAGVTEAILVVNPADVIKIRLQAQKNASALHHQPYKNAIHAFFSIVKSEGISALYRGITLTAARQATNQAINFTVYNELKRIVSPIYGGNPREIPSYTSMAMGFISGAMGPICNAPIDTIKTHVQRAEKVHGTTGWRQISTCSRQIWAQSGFRGFYRGLVPRILRVAPGQAVIFAVYELVSKILKGNLEK